MDSRLGFQRRRDIRRIKIANIIGGIRRIREYKIEMEYKSLITKGELNIKAWFTLLATIYQIFSYPLKY